MDELRPLDERIKDVASLLYPRSAALVGAAEHGEKEGFAIFQYLLSWKGRLYPVCPRKPEIFLKAVHARVENLPDLPGLVVIALPAQKAVEAARIARTRGSRPSSFLRPAPPKQGSGRTPGAGAEGSGDRKRGENPWAEHLGRNCPFGGTGCRGTLERIRARAPSFASAGNPADFTPAADNALMIKTLQALEDDPGVGIVSRIVFFALPRVDRVLIGFLAAHRKKTVEPFTAFLSHGPFTNESRLRSSGARSPPSPP